MKYEEELGNEKHPNGKLIKYCTKDELMDIILLYNTISKMQQVTLSSRADTILKQQEEINTMNNKWTALCDSIDFLK